MDWGNSLKVFKEIYGENVCQLQSGQIYMSISKEYLKSFVGIKLDRPILITFFINNLLKVTVCQQNSKRIAAYFQIESMIKKFLRKSIYKSSVVLVELYQFVLERLENLSKYCLICDVMCCNSDIYPNICSNKLCEYTFKEYNSVITTFFFDNQCRYINKTINFDSIEPEVVDFIVQTFISASKSKREFILDPPPPFQVENYPCMKNIYTDEFKLLLQWLVSTIPITLKKNSKPISTISTPYQFYNENIKARKDSKLLFHGSAFENWHSIIRNGFLVGSFTKLQVNGASCGKGIYLTDSLSIALSYTSTTPMKLCHKDCDEKGKFLPCLDRYRCVALCQVIDDANTVKIERKDANFYVVKESKNVSIMCIFVYCQSAVQEGYNLQKVKDIRELIS